MITQPPPLQLPQEVKDPKGVVDPVQLEATRQAAAEEIQASYDYIKGARKITGTTTREINTKIAAEERRPFYKPLAAIFKDAKDQHPFPREGEKDTNKEARDALIAESIKELGNGSLAVTHKGTEPKDFLDIFLKTITELNPISLLWTFGEAITNKQNPFMALVNTLKGTVMTAVRDTAVAFGTEGTAANMKAMKDNAVRWMKGGKDKDGKPIPEMTVEQAELDLAAGRGTEALGAYLGVDQKTAQAFALQIEQKRKTLLAAAPASGGAPETSAETAVAPGKINEPPVPQQGTNPTNDAKPANDNGTPAADQSASPSEDPKSTAVSKETGMMQAQIDSKGQRVPVIFDKTYSTFTGSLPEAPLTSTTVIPTSGLTLDS